MPTHVTSNSNFYETEPCNNLGNQLKRRMARGQDGLNSIFKDSNWEVTCVGSQSDEASEAAEFIE